MVRQGKRELEIQLLQKKEELSKLAKWKGMEEELLSRQDKLERRETTLSIREEAINESQSSLTNAVIRKVQIEYHFSILFSFRLLVCYTHPIHIFYNII